jgi:hypothetical protein
LGQLAAGEEETDPDGNSDTALPADVKRRSKMWWGLTGIAAAVAIGGFLGWRVNQLGPSEWTVQILATQDWTDTRVDCRSGSVLEIAANGTIYHKPGGRGFSPDGNPDPKARGANVKGLRDVNHAALIGGIDGQPPYFPVGKKKTYICEPWAGCFSASTTKGSTTTAGGSSPVLMRGRSPGRAREVMPQCQRQSLTAILPDRLHHTHSCRKPSWGVVTCLGACHGVAMPGP